jgi:hypothetical protein
MTEYDYVFLRLRATDQLVPSRLSDLSWSNGSPPLVCSPKLVGPIRDEPAPRRCCHHRGRRPRAPTYGLALPPARQAQAEVCPAVMISLKISITCTGPGCQPSP